MDFVTFMIIDEEYALEISQVREVINSREIIPVPDTANFVEGVISLRGKVIPVISVRKKFGFQQEEKSERTIIVQMEDHLIGVVVDSVTGVTKLEEENITLLDKVLKKAEYLTGVGKVEDRLILIMDIEKFLTTTEKSKVKEVHGKVEMRKRK